LLNIELNIFTSHGHGTVCAWQMMMIIIESSSPTRGKSRAAACKHWKQPQLLLLRRRPGVSAPALHGPGVTEQSELKLKLTAAGGLVLLSSFKLNLNARACAKHQ
jgi:hypothetical protein